MAVGIIIGWLLHLYLLTNLTLADPVENKTASEIITVNTNVWPKMQVRLEGLQSTGYKNELEFSLSKVDPDKNRIWIICSAPFPVAINLKQIKPHNPNYSVVLQTDKKDKATAIYSKEISISVPERSTITRANCTPEHSLESDNHRFADILVNASSVTVHVLTGDKNEYSHSWIVLIPLLAFVVIIFTILSVAGVFILRTDRRARQTNQQTERTRVVTWRSPQRMERHPNVFRAVNLDNPPEFEMLEIRNTQ